MTKIKDIVFKRAEIISKTNLNSKNITIAMNEFVVAVLNYFIGIIKISESETKIIDKEIRKILIKNKNICKGASLERIYMKREVSGRGLPSIEMRKERIMSNFINYYEEKDTVRKR